MNDELPEDAKITRVYAGKNYSMALDTTSNKLYSWGMGENFVLGTREDDNVDKPKVVHPKMFYEANVRQVGCGDAHVVVLCSKDGETKDDVPVLDFAQAVNNEPMASQKVEDKVEESKEPIKPS